MTHRVLIVEDDPVIARAHVRVVRRAIVGVEIVTCSTAEAAKVELAFRRFELVISDYNLAGEGTGTGADVLACVRSLADPPRFLFVSANEACAQPGVVWLEKPCSVQTLLTAIAMALHVRVGDAA